METIKLEGSSMDCDGFDAFHKLDLDNTVQFAVRV